jgi:hypothetical protein
MKSIPLIFIYVIILMFLGSCASTAVLGEIEAMGDFSDSRESPASDVTREPAAFTPVMPKDPELAASDLMQAPRNQPDAEAAAMEDKERPMVSGRMVPPASGINLSRIPEPALPARAELVDASPVVQDEVQPPADEDLFEEPVAEILPEPALSQAPPTPSPTPGPEIETESSGGVAAARAPVPVTNATDDVGASVEIAAAPTADLEPSSREPRVGTEAEEPAIEIFLPLEEGNVTRLTLEGRGWVFLESDLELRFISKDRGAQSETFTFYVPDPRSGTLSFQRQNLIGGQLEARSYIAEFDIAMKAESVSGESAVSVGSAGPAEVHTLGDGDDLDISEGLSAAELERIAVEAVQAGQRLTAIEAYETLLAVHPAYAFLDRVQFALAELLESPGIGQDIRRSLSVYKMLVDYHPFSGYEPRAQERIRHIQKTYIRVF